MEVRRPDMALVIAPYSDGQERRFSLFGDGFLYRNRIHLDLKGNAVEGDNILSHYRVYNVINYSNKAAPITYYVIFNILYTSMYFTLLTFGSNEL